MIQFTLDTLPRAKQSMRHAMQTLPNGKTIHRRYPDKKIQANADVLRMMMGPYTPAEPLEGPVMLVLTIVYATKTKKLLKQAYKTSRPDCDNLAKQVCDAMQADAAIGWGGFFKNDAQVGHLSVSKRWGESPMLHVRLEEL